MKKKRAIAPLRCHHCGSNSIIVSAAQQMSRSEGKAAGKSLHARCLCRNCGWEFWSRHHEALAQRK